MTEGIYIQAADGHLIEANPAARRLLGTPSGDLRDVDGRSRRRDEPPRATVSSGRRAANGSAVQRAWYSACKIRSAGADG